MDPTDRLKLRPDIMLVNVINQEAAGLGAAQSYSVKRKRDGQHTALMRQVKKEELTIKIIETGYCSDTRYKEKLKEKKEQHSQLCRILEEEGHKLKVLPIILGTQGYSRESFQML